MGKKNYYFETLQGQLNSLSDAVASRGSARSSVGADFLETAYSRHRTLCIRLIRDFITPIERQDLYFLSQDILDAFSVIAAAVLSEKEMGELKGCSDALADAPFVFDESAVRREDLFRRKAACFRSDAGIRCFEALHRISRRLLAVAVASS